MEVDGLQLYLRDLSFEKSNVLQIRAVAVPEDAGRCSLSLAQAKWSQERNFINRMHELSVCFRLFLRSEGLTP